MLSKLKKLLGIETAKPLKTASVNRGTVKPQPSAKSGSVPQPTKRTAPTSKIGQESAAAHTPSRPKPPVVSAHPPFNVQQALADG